MKSSKQKMRKYWQLFLLSWQNGLVYRLSLLLWRLRQFLSTVMAMTIWTVVFTSQQTAFGYSQAQMITYIFTISILQSLVLASVLNGLSGEVYSGALSKELVKPLNLFAYLGIQDVADKAKNFIFVLIESALIFMIFKPELVLPNLTITIIFLVWLLGGMLLNFWISLLFGAIGFWSPQSWGPRFLFFMMVDFTAGKLFPLDILPQAVRAIVALTPFPYLSYYQTQLVLGRLDTAGVIQHSFILLLWVVVSGCCCIWLWKRGLQDYSAAGQ